MWQFFFASFQGFFAAKITAFLEPNTSFLLTALIIKPKNPVYPAIRGKIDSRLERHVGLAGQCLLSYEDWNHALAEGEGAGVSNGVGHPFGGLYCWPPPIQSS
jgi:hypothetical protein